MAGWLDGWMAGWLDGEMAKWMERATRAVDAEELAGPHHRLDDGRDNAPIDLTQIGCVEVRRRASESGREAGYRCRVPAENCTYRRSTHRTYAGRARTFVTTSARGTTT